MILVAGLAVAGLAGIAAAFYFSMRPGDSRARASQRDRAAASRHPASRKKTTQAPSGRSNRPASPAQPARSARSSGGARSANGRTADRTGSSTVIDFTGPQQMLEDSEPPVADRRAAARRSHPEEPDDAVGTARSRRRVGWRKGSDVDEELWPAEAFGGVSDEQFWDDLASDRPLATTARAAQPEAAANRRPPNAGPLPDLYTGTDRGRGDSAAGRGAGRGSARPQPRVAPDDRTSVQPAVTSPAATQLYPTATQPSFASQPVRAGQQPAEPRRRSRAAVSADEDPLTSPAYSLRPRGSVDGRAYSSSRRSGDQYDAAGGQANGRGRTDGYRSDPRRSDPLRPGDSYGGTGANTAYQYPQQSYAEPTRSAGTTPYGRDGYRSPAGSRTQGVQGVQGVHGVPAGPGGDPRRANGGWSSGQAAGNGAGDGSWGSRPTYPAVNGYRAPYDPRSYDRRLTSLA